MPAHQTLTSADSGEPTGAVTPADALEAIQRMSTSDREAKERTECPTCGRDDFENWHGVKIHHSTSHDENLGLVTVPCDWCGATLERRPRRINEYDRQFCDEDCQGEWRSEHRTGANAFNWRSEWATCEVCGDEFAVPPSRADQNGDRFCGLDCYADWYADEKTGADHPRWRGGYRDYYGPSWPRQRRRARERDGYTCQSCGAEESGLDAELSVHHIRPFRTFDGHESANALSNLVSLCRECHAKWEGIPLRPEVVGDE
jgi:hypothetical protein